MSSEQLHLERVPTNLVTLAHRGVGDFQLNPSHVIEVEAAEAELLGEWDTANPSGR